MADMRNTERHTMPCSALRRQPAYRSMSSSDHQMTYAGAPRTGWVSSRSPKPFSALFVVILTVALTLAGLAASSFTATSRAYATDARTGTLTISAIWNRDTNNPVPLAGDTYSIVRVASADLDKTGKPTAFHTLKAFADFDRDWGSLSASEYNTAAKELAEYAGKHDLYEHSGKTNAAGQLKFVDLPAGLYLAARTSVASANKAYTCDPFLVAVPGIADDGTGEFNATAEPKFSGDDTPEPNPNPNPDNPDNPNPDNPDNPNPDNPEPNPNPTPTPNPGTTPGGSEIPADTGAAISAIAFVAIACTVAAVIIHDVRRDRSRGVNQEPTTPASPTE